MKKIGFKNFRRYEDFPEMNLAPITFMVGENNAGKSTIVKAILAVTNFIIYQNKISLNLDFDDTDSETIGKEMYKEALKNVKFYFNTNYFAHLGTYKRALYNKAENDAIEFTIGNDCVDIKIEVIGDRNNDERVCGMVSKVNILLHEKGVNASFDLFEDKAYVILNPIQELSWNLSPDSRREFYDKYKKPVVLEYEISDYLNNISDFLNNILRTIELAIIATCNPDAFRNTFISRFRHKSLSNLDDYTLGFIKLYEETFMTCLNLTVPTKQFLEIKYIYAHSVSQNVIYNPKDTNDYLSQTIHEYASLPHERNDYRKKFIRRWMKELNIGNDFKITTVGGEAHLVEIKNADEWVNLSDKGMGSIQLMVLLFRLAIKLEFDEEGENKYSLELSLPYTFIIEEPEQNLHPMLQTKLADLFYELNKKYNYRFIVETHSEYIIRKTQVIVKKIYEEDDNALNPFKVYYFNSSKSAEPYYEMKYQKDGFFENDFGGGFFDEASSLAFEIL